jgi:hypothetical protein
MLKTALLIEKEKTIRESFGRLAQDYKHEVQLLIAENETSAAEILFANQEINCLITEGPILERMAAVRRDFPRLKTIELSPEESKLKEMLANETLHIQDCLSALLNSLLLRMQILYPD